MGTAEATQGPPIAIPDVQVITRNGTDVIAHQGGRERPEEPVESGLFSLP